MLVPDSFRITENKSIVVKAVNYSPVEAVLSLPKVSTGFIALTVKKNALEDNNNETPGIMCIFPILPKVIQIYSDNNHKAAKQPLHSHSQIY